MIKRKYGDCTKCPKKNILLYRRNPQECKTCYEELKRAIYRERAKKKEADKKKRELLKPKNKPKKAFKKINAVSKINHLTTSAGERITRAVYDDRVRKAKAKKLQIMLDEYGYIFCEDCKKNTCKPIDCSHDVSEKECIESGVPEESYNVENITMRGRYCHNIHDGTSLGG